MLTLLTQNFESYKKQNLLVGVKLDMFTFYAVNCIEKLRSNSVNFDMDKTLAIQKEHSVYSMIQRWFFLPATNLREKFLESTFSINIAHYFKQNWNLCPKATAAEK